MKLSGRGEAVVVKKLPWVTTTGNSNTNRNFCRYIALDNIVTRKFDGEYLESISEEPLRYNVRLIDRYCKETGKKPENLTKAELKKFILT